MRFNQSARARQQATFLFQTRVFYSLALFCASFISRKKHFAKEPATAAGNVDVPLCTNFVHGDVAGPTLQQNPREGFVACPLIFRVASVVRQVACRVERCYGHACRLSCRMVLRRACCIVSCRVACRIGCGHSCHKLSCRAPSCVHCGHPIARLASSLVVSHVVSRRYISHFN
jgi:hypothetical protein